MQSVNRSRTRWRKALVAEIFVLACLSGCATRVVLVPPGEPVRLRETLRAVKVWAADKTGREVEVTVDLPAGWYCLPDPGSSEPSPGK